MVILKERIKSEDLKNIEPGISYFPDMIKGVADIKNEIVGINAAMHADIEQQLLKSGSKQEDLYGFNIVYDDREIEYDSLINIPRNRDLGYPRGGTTIKDIRIQKKIREVIEKWIVL